MTGGHLNGDYIEYYPKLDKQTNKPMINVKKSYVNGVLDGEYKEWCETILSGHYNYKNGKREGKQYFYSNTTGEVLNEYTCINGEMDGKFYSWMPGHKLYVESNYLQGKLHGIFKRYYNNGKIEIEHTYVNGDINGLCKEWDEDGNLIKEEYVKDNVSEQLGAKIKDTYLEGKHYLKHERWYPNGELAEEIYRLYNKNHGSYKLGYDNGVIGTEMNYKEGLKHGDCLYRWPEGTLHSKCYYVDDQLHGLFQSWYHVSESSVKEQPKKEINYIFGEKHGEYKEWFGNGQIKILCNYKDDKLNGEYNEYYEDGTLKEKLFYKDGEKQV
jgi:antitoxin component YwqK of YwqJK toxin-antitoxin module